MTNPYGITLDRAWTEWAAEYGVSPAVAAAVFLMSKARPIDEVMAKLAPGEFEQVADIVSRWPGQFPPGTLAALKSRRQTPSPDPPAVSVPADQAPRQSSKPEIGKERGSIGNLFGIALDQAWLRWAAAEGVTETAIAAVSLLQERSVEEVAGKLTPAELADVTRLVSRCPSCYPPGAYDALKRAGLAERINRAHDAKDRLAPSPRKRHEPAHKRPCRLQWRRLRQVASCHCRQLAPCNSSGCDRTFPPSPPSASRMDLSIIESNLACATTSATHR